jgi:PTS system mannose-specific IIA component
MIGVVIATHGRLAEETLACAEAAREAIAAAIREVNEGDGVLVLTDMLGGTPANLALGFLGDTVDVVTGVNLPMLLKLSTCRTPGALLPEVARLICAYGQKNITLASEVLRRVRPAAPSPGEGDRRDRAPAHRRAARPRPGAGGLGSAPRRRPGSPRRAARASRSRPRSSSFTPCRRRGARPGPGWRASRAGTPARWRWPPSGAAPRCSRWPR